MFLSSGALDVFTIVLSFWLGVTLGLVCGICDLAPNFFKSLHAFLLVRLKPSFSVGFLHLVLLASSRLCRSASATHYIVLVQSLTGFVASWSILPSYASRNMFFDDLYNSVGKFLVVPRVGEYESYVRVQICRKAIPVSFREFLRTN